jgi:hypothetical protein
MPNHSNDVRELGRRLVAFAYPEFEGRDVKVITGNLRSYGQVRWSDDGGISIICNRDVVKWPEPVIIGLLGHEMSHPAKGVHSSEENTDLDVISRGLGPYLAVERAYVNKYEDHRIGKGKDRYLGFQSIRELLNDHEQTTMRHLLEDFRITPSRGLNEHRLVHDTAIHDEVGQLILMIEGQAIRVEGVRTDSDVKLLFRDEVLYVYVDDEVATEVPWHER